MSKEKGKAYANRKPVEKRKPSDFYETPKSLTWELLKTGELEGVETILDPCCGNYAISEELKKAGFKVWERDLIYGFDFLKENIACNYDAVVMNPPFSLWNPFIEKAKSVSDKVIAIGKTNFFGAQNRYEIGLWNNLKAVYIFTRQVDYQFPIDPDGQMGVGNLITGWFVWQKNWKKDPVIKLIDVNKYCTLGGYDNFILKHPEFNNKHDLLDKAKQIKLIK